MMNNETLIPGRKGRDEYSSATLHAKRNAMRMEAESRQRDYDKLTVDQKVKLAQSRRGKSKREITRLTKIVKK